MSFRNDLLIGQKKEIEFTSILNNQGWTTRTTADKGKFNAYDIEATLNTTTTTINTTNNTTTTTTVNTTTTNTYEVKYDRMASRRTGNIAVEICKRGINDKKIPSGLTVSTADYYVFCVDDDDNFYQIKTDDLKELVLQKKYHSGCWGGDGNNSGILLFNKDYLFSKCG